MLSNALGVIIAQWEGLSAYFHSDSVLLNADVFTVRQLRDMYVPQNKMLLTLVHDRIAQLDNLNRLLQSEQPNQSYFADRLLTFYISLLEEVIAPEEVLLAKQCEDPLSFRLDRY